ncbi:MAG: hypothetical protein MK202_04880 [Tenacibaculum sp.]|nr:hypothetical protein [Tenacibaculum sp.]
MNCITSLKNEIYAICAAIEDSPNCRLELRKQFYSDHGYSKLAKYGYGQSEIDFIKWQIQRGVLNTIHCKSKKGSSWWRKMNMQIIFDSELANKIVALNHDFSEIPESVKYWINYIKSPSSKSWYKAHNSSIISASIKFSDEIESESIIEKKFIQDVLIRVMYAQAMVEGKIFPFGRIGSILANPIFPAVKMIIKRPNLYPNDYPLITESHLQNYIREISNKYIFHKNKNKLFNLISEFFGPKKMNEIKIFMNQNLTS